MFSVSRFAAFDLIDILAVEWFASHMPATQKLCQSLNGTAVGFSTEVVHLLPRLR